MSFHRKITLALVMLPGISFAQVDQCDVIAGVNQIVACAESRSSEVQKAEANVGTKKATEEFAGQLQNPELSSEYVSGGSAGKNQSEFDLSLAFPVEIGGGRAARKSVAKFETQKAELELAKTRSEIRKQVFLNLIRVRQIKEELLMVQESIETFSKLIKQFQNRPKLTPEQDVTLTVFNVAKADYSFKKLEYEEELLKLDSYFQTVIGRPVSSLKVALPTRIKNWPNLPENGSISREAPIVALYEADINVSKADLQKAKSDTWPSLNVGPSLKQFNDGGQNTSQLGVNLSMPLPVLSQNQGGKAIALANIRSAEIRRDLAIKEMKILRENLYQQYVKSTKALRDSESGLSQEQRHKKVENLFFRGLVPSSLVIEAHRTLVEFEKTKNERESRSLENFFDVQILDGKTVEFNL